MISDCISIDKAIALLSTGNWIRESEFLSCGLKRATHYESEFRTTTEVTDLEDFLRKHQELCKGLRAALEYRDVAPERISPAECALRISERTIYKVAPSLRDSMADFLGLLFAGLTATNFFSLFAIWAGLSAWKMVKVLVNGYEKLSDPVERNVFEAVFALQGRISVRDYDALKDKDFELAYGTISPLTCEIAARVQSIHPSEEVEKALQKLKEREILNCNEGRWSIAF